MTSLPRHPAVYSDALLPVFARMLFSSTYVLDPFGGTGKIFKLQEYLPATRFEAVEIEPEWAAYDTRITLGNALYLPWECETFDAVCTSPSYANRMADHHEAKDGSPRVSYKHYLGRPLSEHNSGAMQWGDEYRSFHFAAWTEARRVLLPNGRFVLNIKDHIRKGEVVHVTDWHIQTLCDLGFTVVEHVKVDTPGMGFGQNRNLRIPYESVILLTKNHRSTG